MRATGQAAATAPAKRADAQRNYERLLAAAAAAFSERGGDEVSLEEIARRAGVGIGTLYRHFPARQALLEAVYQDQVDALAVRAQELMSAESPADALAHWLRALVAFGSTKRNLSAALIETVGKDSELMSRSGALLRDASAGLLERAQQAGVARADLQGTDVLRLVHALILAADWAPADSGQADRILSLVMTGLLRENAPHGSGPELGAVREQAP